MNRCVFVSTVIALIIFSIPITTYGEVPLKGKKSAPFLPQNIERIADQDIPPGRATKLSSKIKDIKNITQEKIDPINSISIPPSVSAAGLSGSYRIPGDFINISTAIAILNYVGLSGNTIFELENSNYFEYKLPVISGSYPGSGTFNLTIQPAAGLNVDIDFVSTTEYGKGFVFDGAKNITIDGSNNSGTTLTIGFGMGDFPTNDPFGATFLISNGSENISIINTFIQGNVNNSEWINQTDGRPTIFIWTADSSNSCNKSITIDNCTITNATYAFKVLTEGNLISVDKLTINNCKIGGAFGEKVVVGGLFEFCSNINFTNNIIDGVEYLKTYWDNGVTEYDLDKAFSTDESFLYFFGQSTGSHFLIVDSCTISNNIFRNISTNTVNNDGIVLYGFRVYNDYGTLSIFNNRIYNLTNDDGSGVIIGYRGTNTNFYHNSIRLTGTNANSPTTTCLSVSRTTSLTSNIYNNAFSNEIIQPDMIRVRGINAGGTINNNAIFSAGYPTSSHSTITDAIAAGINTNGIWGPINFDSELHIISGPSSAENCGKSKVLLAQDIDGELRDTTTVGKRDAGADEFPSLSSSFGPDVFPYKIDVSNMSPPLNLPCIPIVWIKNNSSSVTSTFNITLFEPVTGYTQAVSASLQPMEIKSISFPAWTPPTFTNYTFTASTSLSGDINPGNNSISKLVVPVMVDCFPVKVFTFDASSEGWTATGDWVRKNNFTKLSGPYNGYSWVTERPNKTSTYTEGAYASSQGYETTYPGPNLLVSPWFDPQCIPESDIDIGFVHNIRTEPGWDFSWMQYTTDGVTWKHLGKLNDPNGLNWYNESIYKNAKIPEEPCDWPPCFDLGQALYSYGLIENPNDLPPGRWTSNGTNEPTGPDGYVYSCLNIKTYEYPDIVNSHSVRFRYIAFSDPATAPDPGGWAFDHFFITSQLPINTDNLLQGIVYLDSNGNGIKDAGELEQAGIKLNLSYHGVFFDSLFTETDGKYNYMTRFPGIYNLTCPINGYGFTEPFGSNKYDINCPGDGSTKIQNFGLFVGSINGKTFNDVNNNGVKDGGESAASEWTIEVRKDSLNGTLITSDTTDSFGNYSIFVPPYNTYIVKLIERPNSGRITYPSIKTHSVSLTGNSGEPSANLQNIDFGVFYFGTVTLGVRVDINGNTIKDPEDNTSLPSGTGFITYHFFKNDIKTEECNIGDGYSSFFVFGRLDTGIYNFKRISAVPSDWIETTPSEITLVVDTSKLLGSINFMYFKNITVSGSKFNDQNGNGIKDSGEQGIKNIAITISGQGGSSSLTDSNGVYHFANIGPGSHIISEEIPNGWDQTMPPPPGIITFDALSGNIPVNNKSNINFGNFKLINVSGIVFRDRNNDGVKNTGEEGISGWQVALNNGQTIYTGLNGEYTFYGLSPNPDGLTMSLQLPDGWNSTFPITSTYPIETISGVDLLNLDFGVFKTTDSIKYRTFTYEQLGATDQSKIVKWKNGKPIVSAPNTANLLDRLIKIDGAKFLIGLTSQLNNNNKEKAYLYPSKQTEIFKTFNTKGLLHSGPARGFDMTTRGNLMLKRWKTIGSDKKNDLLIPQLLTLKINLIASEKGYTDIANNLGALIYTWPGPWGTEKTIQDISAYADTVMTKWDGVPFWVYDSLLFTMKRINEAFSSPVLTDTSIGWIGSKFKWRCYRTAYDIPFLKSAVAMPRLSDHNPPEPLPTEYSLKQNYPNPFNPTTTLSFDLPEAAFVTLKFYNILGQEIATLLYREEFEAGSGWETDFDASSLPAGVYFYCLNAELKSDEGFAARFTNVKKMIVIK